MYWLLVGLVRSLKISHKEVLRKLLLCEDYNDLTSPTRNQIPDIHIAVSIVYDTLKIFFEHSCSYCLILHLHCGMELKDKYPNFEVGLKCILMANLYLLVCTYIK